MSPLLLGVVLAKQTSFLSSTIQW